MVVPQQRRADYPPDLGTVLAGRTDPHRLESGVSNRRGTSARSPFAIWWTGWPQRPAEPGWPIRFRRPVRIFDVQFVRAFDERQPAPCDVRDRAVVRDAEHERAFRAFVPEARQRSPDRERDLLQQILTLAGSARVARRQASECGAVRREKRVEPLFKFRPRQLQPISAVTHPARAQADRMSSRSSTRAARTSASAAPPVVMSASAAP